MYAGPLIARARHQTHRARARAKLLRDRARTLSRLGVDEGSLGARRIDRLKIWLVCVSTLIRERAPALRDPAVRVELVLGARRRSVLISDPSDLIGLREVLGEREYEVELPGEPRTILDLGSHIGESILYFQERYPGARIVGVEPNPEAFARLKANVGSLAGVELYEAALSDRDGEADLYVEPLSWGSSLVASRLPYRAVRVRTLTLDTLRRMADLDDVDLMKMDIEGSEWVAFSRPGALDRVTSLLGELHLEGSSRTPADFYALFPDHEGGTIRDNGYSALFCLTRRAL